MSVKAYEYCREIPVLDSVQVESLREAIGGEVDLAQELLDAFTDECEPALKRMSVACQSHDYGKVQELAHFMAGSSANLGLQRFSQACRMAEEALIDGDIVEADLPKRLRALYEEGVAASRRTMGLS